MASGRPKRALFASIAIAGSTVLSLLAIELIFRVFSIVPPRFPPSRFYVDVGGELKNFGNRWGAEKRDGQHVFHIKRPSRFAPQGVSMGEHVPNARFRIVYGNEHGEFDPSKGAPVEFNSLGLRGPEINREKPAGTFRILGLGDSFTFGWGVRDEHTFLRRLERSLNERASEPRFEVLNAGVPGYNTRDEVIYLENVWLDLSPDLVLIVFFLNDAYDDAAFLIGRASGTDLAQPEGLARISYLYDYAQHTYRVRQLSETIKSYYHNQFFAEPQQTLEQASQYDWTNSRSALERAALLARQSGLRLAVVIFPHLVGLEGEYPFEAIHRMVADTCRALSIPVLDLLDAFRGQRSRNLWVHVSDQHANEKGHEIAARAMEEFLRTNSLVP